MGKKIYFFMQGTHCLGTTNDKKIANRFEVLIESAGAIDIRRIKVDSDELNFNEKQFLDGSLYNLSDISENGIGLFLSTTDEDCFVNHAFDKIGSVTDNIEDLRYSLEFLELDTHEFMYIYNVFENMEYKIQDFQYSSNISHVLNESKIYYDFIKETYGEGE